jgi:hypothetical protein
MTVAFDYEHDARAWAKKLRKTLGHQWRIRIDHYDRWPRYAVVVTRTKKHS